MDVFGPFVEPRYPDANGLPFFAAKLWGCKCRNPPGQGSASELARDFTRHGGFKAFLRRGSKLMVSFQLSLK